MFHDEASVLLSILPCAADDADDAENLAGGGGGPASEEQTPVGAEEENLTEDAVAGESPSEHEPEEVSSHPDATIEEDQPELSDEEVFMAALDAMPTGKPKREDVKGDYPTLSEGDVVEGTVVHIDREGVLVDVGTKSEGIIRLPELTRDPSQNPEDVVSVGETIKVYVLKPEGADGNLLLSKKRADFEIAWDRVQLAHDEGQYLTAMVTDRVKGGLVVDLGIRGFVPASHVGSGKVKNLDKYLGQSLPLKVLEVDRERKKVVLSHRMAVEEQRDKKREETLGDLAEGQVRAGVVRRITDYGAFVDLGGLDGLLHISEMSWTRINHPSEVVKVGQKIQVMVLKVNSESGRVSLGMRQILPDPWQNLGDRYNVGDIIHVKISRLVPFGAFVQLEEGVEAIIPNQELSQRRIKKPEQVVAVGDEVDAKILDLRPDERRMTLSTRAVMPEPAEIQAPPPPRPQAAQSSGREAPRTTIADMLGDSFAEKLDFEQFGQKAKSRERKKMKAKAQERDEEEAFGDLSEDELLDLAVVPEEEPVENATAEETLAEADVPEPEEAPTDAEEVPVEAEEDSAEADEDKA